MIQKMIVGLVVIVAACFVMVHFAPRKLRQTCRARTAKLAKRLGWSALEKKLSANTPGDASCADGCGACGGCGPTSPESEKQSTITPETLRRTIRR